MAPAAGGADFVLQPAGGDESMGRNVRQPLLGGGCGGETTTNSSSNKNNNDNNALFGKYEVGKLLGCGAFAKVYHARDVRSGQSVAIKVINKKKMMSSSGGNSNAAHKAMMMNNLKREVSIMHRLRHPHIVRLHEVLATRTKIYLVLELLKGGELFAKVAKGRLSEDVSRRYFHQLISALAYCHSRGVFHRDLKPENLLLDDSGRLKVSDFGLSALQADQMRHDGGLLRTLCGTPAYVAPEILGKKGYDGAKVDVWSSGVILFVLTAGHLPFSHPNLMAMYKKIYKGEFKCPKWMSPDLKRLLSRLLDTNPATRITVDEIIRHPWFTKGGGYDQLRHHIYSEQEEQDDDKISGEAKKMGDEPLNAFDIISFSSGLDLSGLFEQSGSTATATWEDGGERFVSAEAPLSILDRIQALVTWNNDNKQDCCLTLRVKKRTELGLKIEAASGGQGELGMGIQVYRLTEGLVVVEARRRSGDVWAYNEAWRKLLKPQLLLNPPLPQPGSSIL